MTKYMSTIDFRKMVFETYTKRLAKERSQFQNREMVQDKVRYMTDGRSLFGYYSESNPEGCKSWLIEEREWNENYTVPKVDKILPKRTYHIYRVEDLSFIPAVKQAQMALIFGEGETISLGVPHHKIASFRPEGYQCALDLFLLAPLAKGQSTMSLLVPLEDGKINSAQPVLVVPSALEDHAESLIEMDFEGLKSFDWFHVVMPMKI